jgi:hypothetical protein
MKLTAAGLQPQPVPIISYAAAFGLGAAFAYGSVTALAGLAKTNRIGIAWPGTDTSDREHAARSYANS